MAEKALTTTGSFALQLTGANDADYLAPGESLDITDLPRMKVPAGGGLIWTLPSGEPAKTLNAVILAFHVTRAFWAGDYDGEGVPPDCSSNDGIDGEGIYGRIVGEGGEVTMSNANPTGKCASCPMAAFGSGKGRAQACRVITRLLLLLENNPLPCVLNVPAGSYDAFKNYRTTVLRPLGIPPHATTTKISLVAAKSSTGIEYSQLRFDLGEPISEALVQQIVELRANIAR